MAHREFDETLMDAAIAAAIAAAETSSPAYAGGNAGATETLVITNGEIQDWTLDASTVFTLHNAPASATGTLLWLNLTQNATGGWLPTFLTASGDTLEWLYGVAPSANNFHTNPTQVNNFLFISANNRIIGIFLNPKDSGTIHTGGAFLQIAMMSFLGDATVSKRGGLTPVAAEVQTTDATLTTVLSVPVELNTTVFALSFCVGARSTGAESSVALLLSGWRRGSSGNVAEIASEVIIGSMEDSSGAPAWSSAVDTTNQLGLVQVTNEAAKTFNNAVFALYFKVTQ